MIIIQNNIYFSYISYTVEFLINCFFNNTLERDATDINNLINFYNIASLDLSVLMRFLCGPHITPRKNQMGPMWAMWERHGHHIPTLPHVNTKWGPCGLCGKDMGPTCPCRTQIGPIWGPLSVLAGKTPLSPLTLLTTIYKT